MAAFRSREFSAGLRTGLVVLAIGLLLYVWSKSRQRQQPPSTPPVWPVAGSLVTVAYIEALRETRHLLPGMALAIALLAGGGELAYRRRLGVVGRSLLVTPGAILLSTTAGLDVLPVWIRLLVAGATIAATLLISDLERRTSPTGLAPVLLAVTVVGVYETVPEPGLVLPVLVVTVLVAVLAWPVPIVSLGGGSAAVVGAIAWAAAVGGRGRLGSVVGAAACFGLFVAEPLARQIDSRHRGLADMVLDGRRLPVVLVAAAHLAVVYVASRVAGTSQRLSQSIVLALVDLMAATALTLATAHVLGAHRGRAPTPEGLDPRTMPSR